jgi:hypothetical protein
MGNIFVWEDYLCLKSKICVHRAPNTKKLIIIERTK